MAPGKGSGSLALIIRGAVSINRCFRRVAAVIVPALKVRELSHRSVEKLA